MIIFGWGFQTVRNFGPAFKRLCDNCSNEEYWILTRVITWFTLFFIPIIPYEIKHHLVCPICKYGFVLDEEQISKVKPLAEANQLLVEGKISDQEYRFRLTNQSVLSEPENGKGETSVVNVPTGGQSSQTYCVHCGQKASAESKFCGSCGTQLNS